MCFCDVSLGIDVCMSYTQTLIHCNSIITRSSRYIIYTRDRCSKSLTRPLSQVFTNAPPTVIWYGTSVSVFSFIVTTHELFINRGINRWMLVEYLSCNWFTVFISFRYLLVFGDENASVLKIETVQVQASLLPWQADVIAMICVL